MPNGKQLLAIKPATLMVNEARNEFARIGTEDQAPATNRAEEAVAWEYAVAAELLRAAKTRKDKAQKAAIEAGVLPDTAEQPRAPGTNEIVYEGSWVQLQLRVNNPTSVIDVALFEQALRDKRVKQSVIDECKLVATRSNKPAHQFNAVFRNARADVQGK